MIWGIIIAIIVLLIAGEKESPIWMKPLGIIALLYLMLAVCSAC